ncbi:hypothetical protein KUTeg_012755 [Tegillarca granosa]|uniref:Tyr recombinase domain-containing protein n=1 Tax=Tegillarca granosa TaxID=220873 RepID=A0ABQ9F5Q5_TEGGR|nr:hypothetical protein KUTeg_012755 [Tegillarca granosa]
MERDEAEASESGMLRPRKQTGGQKENRKSPQRKSRKGKDRKRRRPQTGGRKRQKVSVATLPPPSSDSSSESEVEVSPLGNEVTICWAASKVPGPAWRQYDKQFRLRRAKKPSKSWARLDLDLWLLRFTNRLGTLFKVFGSSTLCLMNFQCHIVQYIAYLSLKSLSYQTVKTRIAALSIFHKISNSTDHTKSFLVNKLLEGIRRSGKSKKSRAPITLPILIQLPRALVCICFSSYEAKLFHAPFIFAFFGFLRVGEIALSTRKSNSSTVLSISDILIQTGMLKEKIRFSKTDQFGIPLLFTLTLSLHQLFVHFKKKCLKFFNLGTQQFRSHSFRIGAASLARMKNIPPNVIQSFGRWKSDAYRGYIHIWIVGSSIVYWAQRRAINRPVGRKLGLEKYGVQIRWCGIRGMN